MYDDSHPLCPDNYRGLDRWCCENSHFLKQLHETHWRVLRSDGNRVLDFWPTTGRYCLFSTQQGFPNKTKLGGENAIIEELESHYGRKQNKAEKHQAREARRINSEAEKIADAAAPMIAEAVMKQLGPVMDFVKCFNMARDWKPSPSAFDAFVEIDKPIVGRDDYEAIIHGQLESAIKWREEHPEDSVLYRTSLGRVLAHKPDAKVPDDWVKIDAGLIKECREAVEANRPKRFSIGQGVFTCRGKGTVRDDKGTTVVVQVDGADWNTSFLRSELSNTEIPVTESIRGGSILEVHITDDGVVEKSAAGPQAVNEPEGEAAYREASDLGEYCLSCGRHDGQHETDCHENNSLPAADRADQPEPIHPAPSDWFDMSPDELFERAVFLVAMLLASPDQSVESAVSIAKKLAEESVKAFKPR